MCRSYDFYFYELLYVAQKGILGSMVVTHVCRGLQAVWKLTLEDSEASET